MINFLEKMENKEIIKIIYEKIMLEQPKGDNVIYKDGYKDGWQECCLRIIQEITRNETHGLENKNSKGDSANNFKR